MPGSISQTSGKCGKKKCRCYTDPDYVHGPYYPWTGKLGGRTTSVILSQEGAKECQVRIDRWRDLEQQVSSLAQEGLLRAPWEER